MINSRRMRWEGHVARMGEKRNAYTISVGKPEGKRPLGRKRRRWVDNMKMDLREIEWDGIDWIDLAQDRDHLRALVNTAMNLRDMTNLEIVLDIRYYYHLPNLYLLLIVHDHFHRIPCHVTYRV
jgi:hypothetical protein